jgi:hypothetical protein
MHDRWRFLTLACSIALVLFARYACAQGLGGAAEDFRLGSTLQWTGPYGELTGALICDPHRDRVLVPLRASTVILGRALPGDAFDTSSLAGSLLPPRTDYGHVLFETTDLVSTCIKYTAAGPNFRNEYAVARIDVCEGTVLDVVPIGNRRPVQFVAVTGWRLFVNFDSGEIQFISLTSFGSGLSTERFAYSGELAFMVYDGSNLHALRFAESYYTLIRIDPNTLQLTGSSETRFGAVAPIDVQTPAHDLTTNHVFFYVPFALVQADLVSLSFVATIDLGESTGSSFHASLLSFFNNRNTLHLVGSDRIITLFRQCIDQSFWTDFSVVSVQNFVYNGLPATLINACVFPETDDLVVSLLGADINSVSHFRRLPDSAEMRRIYPLGLRGYEGITPLGIDEENQIGFFHLFRRNGPNDLKVVDLLRMEDVLTDSFTRAAIVGSLYDLVGGRIYVLRLTENLSLLRFNAQTFELENSLVISDGVTLLDASNGLPLAMCLFEIDALGEQLYIVYRHQVDPDNMLHLRRTFTTVDLSSGSVVIRDEDLSDTFLRNHCSGTVVNTSLAYFVDYFLRDDGYQATVTWRNPDEWLPQPALLTDISHPLSISEGGLLESQAASFPPSDILFGFFDQVSSLVYLPVFSGYLRIDVRTSTVLDNFIVDAATHYVALTAPPLLSIFPTDWTAAYPISAAFPHPPAVYYQSQRRLFYVVKRVSDVGSEQNGVIWDSHPFTDVDFLHEDLSELRFAESLLLDDVHSKLYVVGIDRLHLPTVQKVYLVEGEDDLLEVGIQNTFASGVSDVRMLSHLTWLFAGMVVMLDMI